MSFDGLAPHYRWMEFVLAGNKLQRCRTAFLNAVAGSQEVLVAGEGNGRFLLECRRRLAAAHITCLDASGRMLSLARRRLERQELNLNRIEFIHADVFDWKPPGHAFDLIVTHFFLDCFRPDQLAFVVEKLANLASPKAVWLLADFQVPESGPSRYRAQAIHGLMYTFFGVATHLPARRLTCPDAALQAQGFALCERQQSDWGLLHSDLWTRRELPRNSKRSEDLLE